MRKILSIIILLSVAVLTYGHYLIPDSISLKLSQVNGETKLRLLHELYLQNNGNQTAFRYLDMLLDESVKQKNKRMEMQVLGMQIQAFVNINRSDSVIKRAPEVIKLMRQNEEFKLMFSTQDLLIGQLMMSKRFVEALRMTNEQMKEAQRLDNSLGLAIANKNLGMIYRFTGRSAEVWKFYMESLKWLKKANEKSLIVDLYLDIITINHECMQLTQALDNCNKCITLIKENMRGEKRFSEKNKLTAQFFTCLCIKASVYLNLKNTKEAEKCIAQAREMVNPAWSGIWLFPLWEAEIAYNIQTANYTEALKYIRLYGNCIDSNQLTMQLYLTKKMATIYEGMNLLNQACEKYRQAEQIKDTLYSINFAKQLDEIRSLYEVDKLEMKAEKDQLNFIFLLVGTLTLFVVCILMGVIVFIVRRNSSRLEEKNRSLFLQLKEKDTLRAEITRLSNSSPRKEKNDTLSPHNILFSRFQKWLETDNRFTNLKLTPEEVAAELATNTRYLYDAIRQSTGYTFNDYINNLKLEFARKLLLSDINNQMTIEGISNEAGFNTRSNFYRLFRLKYGLTPSELCKQEEDTLKDKNKNRVTL